MALNDYGKMGMLALVFLVVSVLLALGHVDQSTWDKIAMLELGYLIGNGVNAVRKQAPSPVLVPRIPDPAGEG